MDAITQHGEPVQPAEQVGGPAAVLDPAPAQRWDAGEIFRREATVSEIRADEDKRTVELSFSSELPVQRGQYMEVLSHDPADVDLSRLNDAHPLLLNHDPERQIGVVERATLDGNAKRGRAVVRFSRSPLGEEIWRDVRDGIRRLVSVGYRRMKEVTSEMRDGVELVRFAWQPHEISIVSIPADATVGIGRNQPLSPSHEQKDPKPMQVEIVNDAASAVAGERKRVNEIRAIAKNLSGKVQDVDALANAAIERGDSLDSFRAAALERLPSVDQISKPAALDVKPKEWARYSISRAITSQMNGRLDGFEAEMNQEIALKTGRNAGGFWLPDEVMARNFTQGTGTLGGMLVQTTNAGDQFIELLRNRAQVINLGARVIDLAGPTTIPRQNAAGATNWVGETVAATLETGNFTQMTLTPQAVSAFQQYSKQLLLTNNPSIDNLIRDDISQQIALAIDLAALHGSGSGQPRGVVNTTGIGTVALATNGLALGNATAYPAMVSLESVVAAANADKGSLAYLMRAGHRGALKTNSRFASSDTPVWEPNSTVNGYRAEVSQQIATNLTTGTATTICSAVIFGDWSQVLVANFGPTDLTIDPYRLAENGVVRVIARRWVDVGVRTPGSFAVLGGVLTT